MKKISKRNNILLNIIICMSIIIFFLSSKENIKIDIFNIFFKYKILSIYLIVINFITFIIFAIDKYKSIKNKWRIKESTLINLCFIGGSIGGYLSMYLFHHKTKQSCFYIGIPLIIVTQIIILIYLTNII